MKRLSSQDRSALLKLAQSLPKGDEHRRAILSGLQKLARWEKVYNWEEIGLQPEYEPDDKVLADKVLKALGASDYDDLQMIQPSGQVWAFTEGKDIGHWTDGAVNLGTWEGEPAVRFESRYGGNFYVANRRAMV